MKALSFSENKMHIKLVIIFFISIFICHQIRAQSSVTITSQSDWESGVLSPSVTSGQTGALRLSTGFVNGYDDFNGGLKPWWTNFGSAVLPGILRHSIVANAGQRVGVWSGAFSAVRDLQISAGINVGCSGCFLGGLGFDSGSQQAQVRLSGANLSFPGAINGPGSLSVNAGWNQIRMTKSGDSYFGETRQNGSVPWTFLGSITMTASSVMVFLGLAPTSTNSYTMEYQNFDAKPLSSQGTWTSTTYSLSGTPSTVGSIRWTQDSPTGTHIDIQTATSADGLNWSNWSPVYVDSFGSTITSPTRPFIRVAATLYSDPNHEFSPILKDITIIYPDATPLKPNVTSITHPTGLWSNMNPMQITWSMPSGNPAPESSYGYWLAVGASVTRTASGTGLTATAGQTHSLVIPLPQEGQYTFGLTVTADAFSGGLTATSAPYTFNYDGTPPGQVNISSPTHPPLLFTNNNSPVFKLSATDSLSGVSGYATVLDKAATGEPGNVVNNGEDIRFTRLDNGTYYLHARAIDMAGNTGPVSHYGIRIDFNGALLAQDYVKALPNPVRGNIARLEYELAAPATEVYLEFMNSQGELLKTVDGSRIVGKNYYNWDVSGLANGVYLFRVKAKSSEDGKAFSVIRKVAVIR
jgi:hypothetical protein